MNDSNNDAITGTWEYMREICEFLIPGDDLELLDDIQVVLAILPTAFAMWLRGNP